MSKERGEDLNPCKNGHSLGVVSKLIEIGGKEEKDHFIGCIECGEPLKVGLEGETNLGAKKRASPNC